jgi:hypothetical protein
MDSKFILSPDKKVIAQAKKYAKKSVPGHLLKKYKMES